MIVRELLLNALANAGHIHDGKSAEADELDLALRLFNSEMRALSNKNMITAYQKVFDIKEAMAESVIGGYRTKKGRNVFEFKGELPNASQYVPNRDFALLDKSKWFRCHEVSTKVNAWVECEGLLPCDVVSDFVVPDMERIINVMYRNSSGQWNDLRFVPLSMFYTEDDDLIYCTTAEGENRVRMFLPNRFDGKEVKIVYNTKMDFRKNDDLDLPDAHIALVEIAVTTALLRKDADSDPTRLNNYKEQLRELTDDIMANTSTERRIMRSTNGADRDRLRSGSFIYR